MSYSAEEFGYDKSDKQLGTILTNAKKRYGTYLEGLGDAIVSEARSNLQNDQHVVRGDLVASVGILEDNEGNDILVGSPLPYAGIIEDGRPEVKPVNAKVLHWKDKDGNDVFSKSSAEVPASPWLLPAVISQLHEFPKVFAEREGKFVKEASS